MHLVLLSFMHTIKMIQQRATLDKCDWSVVLTAMRDVLRSASMRHGAQSVTISGVQVMHQWSADSLVTLDSVNQLYRFAAIIKVVL